jgi:hypothetical protein
MIKEYEELKAKIMKVNPSIMDLKFGCIVKSKEYETLNTVVWSDNEKVVYVPKENDFNFDYKSHYDNGKFEIIGRPITIEDVALALNYDGSYFINFTSGYIGRSVFYGKNIVDRITKIKWLLGKTLDQQTDETIRELNKIIN